MKKGDIIERRKELPAGTVLIMNCPTLDFAEEQMLHIEKHYNFHEIPKMTTSSSREGICVVLDEDSFLTVQARVNWVFEDEMAIEYLDTGGMVIINLKEPNGMGWAVIHEATPVYQDSVEHLTDEQLRQSIEDLRSRRLSTPIAQRMRKVKAKTVKESPEDKQLEQVLGGMSVEDKMELMKKLGLVD